MVGAGRGHVLAGLDHLSKQVADGKSRQATNLLVLLASHCLNGGFTYSPSLSPNVSPSSVHLCSSLESQCCI